MINVDLYAFVLFIILLRVKCEESTTHYPEGLHKHLTCEDFGRTGRFNPYSVVNQNWMVFYYWGPYMPMTQFRFYYPDKVDRLFLHQTLDNKTTVPVDWTARMVIMKEITNKVPVLIVESGDRGQFWLYAFPHGNFDDEKYKMEPQLMRFKQTGDKKYIGMMFCELGKVYVMSRMKDLPKKAKLQDAAATIGFRGRKGRSYLYQGHHWMPMDEMDEEEFWEPYRKHHQRQKSAEKNNINV